MSDGWADDEAGKSQGDEFCLVLRAQKYVLFPRTGRCFFFPEDAPGLSAPVM